VVGSLNANDDVVTRPGGAYVFHRATNWSEIQRLPATGLNDSASFGISVGAGGSDIVVGAVRFSGPTVPTSGAFFAFTND
jgi:hypothetical protein